MHSDRPVDDLRDMHVGHDAGQGDDVAATQPQARRHQSEQRLESDTAGLVEWRNATLGSVWMTCVLVAVNSTV